MKILVTRSSLFLDNAKPCDDAQKCSYTDVDERTVDDPRKNKYLSDWYSDPRFTNHRVENGHIKRDQNIEGWCICLNTLDELKLFADKHGKCVVSVKDNNPDMMHVEIYDTYRE